MTEIFKWKPWKISFRDETEFNVLISKFEADYEQRRKKVERSLRTFTWMFHRKTAGSYIDDAILDFYEARGGTYEAFYLPTFADETTLDASYAGGSILQTVDASRFSEDVNKRNNLFCIQDATNFDVSSIISFQDSPPTSLEIIGLSHAYNKVGTKIHRAYKVRFAQPFTRNFTFDGYYQTEIRFQEVH